MLVVPKADLIKMTALCRFIDVLNCIRPEAHCVQLLARVYYSAQSYCLDDRLILSFENWYTAISYPYLCNDMKFDAVVFARAGRFITLAF